MDRIELLAAQLEPLARGDEHLHARCRIEQIDDQIKRAHGVPGAFCQQMFKVIQDQQQPLGTQQLQEQPAWIIALQGNVQRCCNCCRQRSRTADRRQRYKPDAVHKRVHLLPANLDSQSRFTHAAWSRQCDQTHPWPLQLAADFC